MGTYYIPRNVKGEGRILIIFSVKALIYTAVGALIGIFFYFILNTLGLPLVGLGIIAILGFIGFLLGTVKIPDTSAFVLTQKTGGENLDTVIMKWIKFKKDKEKIYVCMKEEKHD